MSNANVDGAIVQKMIRNCHDTIARIEKSKQGLIGKYQSLSGTWSDTKYKDLGVIVDECSSAITSAASVLKDIVQKMEQLNLHIKEYEGVNFSGANSGNGSVRDTGLFGLLGSRSASGSNQSDGTGNVNQILNSPRSLSQTRQGWHMHSNNSSVVFNTPIETGHMLDANQGKVRKFLGTCGLVSCVNVLRMAGMNISEADIVSYASSHRNAADEDYLCTVNSSPGDNGGTHQFDRQEILEHFGLQSESRTANIQNISDAVREGRGVIISVDAGRFWDNPRYNGGGHAVTVTSVQMDNNSQIEGFYICDSGTQGRDEARYVTAEHLQNSLNSHVNMNVTSIIR
jgi:hypothetical protein